MSTFVVRRRIHAHLHPLLCVLSDSPFVMRSFQLSFLLLLFPSRSLARSLDLVLERQLAHVLYIRRSPLLPVLRN